MNFGLSFQQKCTSEFPIQNWSRYHTVLSCGHTNLCILRLTFASSVQAHGTDPTHSNVGPRLPTVLHWHSTTKPPVTHHSASTNAWGGKQPHFGRTICLVVFQITPQLRVSLETLCWDQSLRGKLHPAESHHGGTASFKFLIWARVAFCSSKTFKGKLTCRTYDYFRWLQEKD